ncbi:MAG: hypothetical protein LBN07_03910 [Christensenellaceae bacterium]|jgi:hypothetical protein|nr:hypothetical protein [Christensenellaceae bacterium]
MIKKISIGAFIFVTALTLVLGLGFSDAKTVYADDPSTVTIKFFDRGELLPVVLNVSVGTTLGNQGIIIPDIASFITEYVPGTGPEAGLVEGQDYEHTPPKWYVGDRPFDSSTIISSELISGGEVRVDTRYFYNQYWVTIIYDNNKQLKKLVTYDGTVEITAPPGGLVFGQYLSYNNDETQNITGPRTIIVHVKTFVWYLLGAILLVAFMTGIALLWVFKKEDKLIKRDEVLRQRLLIAAKNQDARVSKLQSKRIAREEEAAQKLVEEAEAKRKATEKIDGFPKI